MDEIKLSLNGMQAISTGIALQGLINFWKLTKLTHIKIILHVTKKILCVKHA